MKKKIVFNTMIILSLFLACAPLAFADSTGIILNANTAYFSIDFNIYQIISIGVIVLALFFSSFFFYIKFRTTQQTLSLQAHYDEVVDCRNIRGFFIQANSILVNNPTKRYSLVIADIEKFSLYNDYYGREAGNDLLRMVSKHFKERTNEQFETYGRVSADEFVALIETPTEEVLIERSVASLNKFSGNWNKIGKERFNIIFGAYTLDLGETNLVDSYEKVNLAHKEAKKQSKSFYVYDEKVKALALKEQDIEFRMLKALENEEFKVYLQPQYNTATESICAAEALTRWVEADGSVVSPAEFLYLFEKNGFIVKLDYYMFEKVCQLISEWKKQGIKPITVSVNFSGLHITNDEWIKDLVRIADKYDVEYKYLSIELTETVMVDNTSVLLDVINKVKSAGFEISIDDFGSGYSSLGLLKSFKVDTIKMDKSFFDYNKNNETRLLIIVESIIKMAKRLSNTTVAEGIESLNQVQYLRLMKCDIIQGYYYSKPIPANELTEKLKTEKIVPKN